MKKNQLLPLYLEYKIINLICVILFYHYIPVGKTLLDYTNLFSPKGYKKNGKIICKYFKDNLW